MEYIGSAEAAKKWGVSERSVRNYCATGRVSGALRLGKSWLVPSDAQKPTRANGRAANENALLSRLRMEKAASLPGGIYHRVQIDLTYNSNHIEGSTLSYEQTRLIFETNTLAPDGPVSTDDLVETSNHFRCVDMIIDNANRELTQHLIKQLHATLKAGTSDSRKSWFAVGDYKRLPNEVGGMLTAPPSTVHIAMADLLEEYEREDTHSFDDLLDFHYRFERIHPFQDGNGRVGRLILFKECLRNGMVPFIIGDDLKLFYYRGLQEWEHERGFLRDTCLTAQDRFKELLDGFEIAY